MIPSIILSFIKCVIFFLLDGSLSDAVSVTGDRFSVVGQGNLQIESTQLEDAGVYVCSASNPSSTIPMITESHLKVLGKLPTICAIL